MSQLDVRVEKLPPMRVASLWGFGPQPEDIAWQKLRAWAGPRGLLDKPEEHPIFGFNNPNPSAGSPNYGYEASLGGLRVKVRRDGQFWEASYHGNPMLHNPIEKADGGRYSIGCTCPTIEVGNGFEKRKDAAEAALDVLRKEVKNWAQAQREVNAADPGAPLSIRIRRARERFAELSA